MRKSLGLKMNPPQSFPTAFFSEHGLKVENGWSEPRKDEEEGVCVKIGATTVLCLPFQPTSRRVASVKNNKLNGETKLCEFWLRRDTGYMLLYDDQGVSLVYGALASEPETDTHASVSSDLTVERRFWGLPCLVTDSFVPQVRKRIIDSLGAASLKGFLSQISSD